MLTSGEQSAHTLQELIQLHQVNHICIHQLSSLKLYDQSPNWSFGHEFIQVGDSSYNLNRLVKYQIAATTLSLYF
jgi:hypothetical protein